MTMVGASAALTGFALVFFGLVLPMMQRLIAGRDKPGVAPIFGEWLNELARWFLVFLVAALAVFVLGVLVVVLGVTWLAATDGHPLYVATIVLFFLENLALVVMAVAIGWVLWRNQTRHSRASRRRSRSRSS